MSAEKSHMFQNLWMSLLDDDNGISEEAYGALLDLGEELSPVWLKDARRLVDATDGRFYISHCEEVE